MWISNCKREFEGRPKYRMRMQVIACRQGAAPSQYSAHLAEFVACRSLFVTTETFNISGHALSGSAIHKLHSI